MAKPRNAHKKEIFEAFQPEYFDLMKAMASVGGSDADYCNYFGISRANLYRWYNEVPGLFKAAEISGDGPNQVVKRSFFEKAKGYTKIVEKTVKTTNPENGRETYEIVDVEEWVPGNTAAAAFWLKNNMGWQEKSAVEVGRMAPSPVNLDLLNDEELAAYEEMTLRIAGKNLLGADLI